MPRETFTFEGKRYDLTAKTDKELSAKVALKKRDLEEGKKKISKNMTLDSWKDEYLEAYKKPSVSTEYYKSLARDYQNWIHPHMGQMYLKDIKPLHCQKALNALVGKSKSLNTKITQLLRGMLETAFDNSLILENPMKNLKTPDYIEGSHRQITAAERTLILKVAETHEYGLWILTMLDCGLRPNETERIKGCHIDLKNKRLYVDGTKTKAAKRYVPIPEPLFNKMAVVKVDPFDYLFVQKTTGRKLTKTSRRRMWLSFRREMNIQMGCKVFRNALVPPFPVAADLVPYCLRHTFCTDLQDAGVPINVAKELMGHTSIETTSKYYTHFTTTAFDNAAELINKHHVGDAVGTPSTTVEK